MPTHDGIRFAINGQHPLIASLGTRLAPEDADLLRVLLDSIAASLPVEMIYSDYSTHPREINQKAVDESQTLERLKSLRLALYGDGPGDSECVSPDRALDAPLRWPDRAGRKIHQRVLFMSIAVILEERNLANALISGLANMPQTPTREQVEEKARQVAAIFGYTGDLRNIVTEAMVSVDTRMGAGVSLVDVTAKHDDQWVHKREDISWAYAKSYEEFLRNEGWPPQMVQSLSDVTTRILGHLQDPRSEGTAWNRRGLVIGHVQSGKTANYTGLIARAADAGYKFIIVIAGIHNNLRKQTQQRIDEAFIGRSSDPDDRRNIGVGLAPGLSASGHAHQHQRGFQQEHGGQERLEDQRLQQADHSGHQEERRDAHWHCTSG
jgi:hypothetical protein